LEIGTSGAGGTGAISFAGTDAAPRLDAPVSGAETFADTLPDLEVGDRIDIVGLPFNITDAFATPASSATWDMEAASRSDSLLINLVDPASSNFAASRDGSGGTVITMMCDCAGTRIAVPGGSVAVGDFRQGYAVRPPKVRRRRCAGSACRQSRGGSPRRSNSFHFTA
jgi:hypothetical protein